MNWWFYEDAAHDGGVLVTDYMRHLFTRIENVDSVTIAPYQVLFKLYDCKVVIYEIKELAKQAYS